MQTQTTKPMTKQDFITILEKLNHIEQQNIAIEAHLKEQKEASSKPSPLLLNARDVGEAVGISTKRARNLIAMPNFPKNITDTRGKYKTGPWRYEEVFRFFKINKSKV